MGANQSNSRSNALTRPERLNSAVPEIPSNIKSSGVVQQQRKRVHPALEQNFPEILPTLRSNVEPQATEVLTKPSPAIQSTRQSNEFPGGASESFKVLNSTAAPPKQRSSVCFEPAKAPVHKNMDNTFNLSKQRQGFEPRGIGDTRAVNSMAQKSVTPQEKNIQAKVGMVKSVQMTMQVSDQPSALKSEPAKLSVPISIPLKHPTSMTTQSQGTSQMPDRQKINSTSFRTVQPSGQDMSAPRPVPSVQSGSSSFPRTSLKAKNNAPEQSASKNIKERFPPHDRGDLEVQSKMSSTSTVSSGQGGKKKLIVRGLRNFVESRGRCPPTWIKEFPCRSRYHPDSYIYDFSEGPNVPRRCTDAMNQCTKKGGRCDKCGIYTGDICLKCRRCDRDCECPKPAQGLNPLDSSAWAQAQKVLADMNRFPSQEPIRPPEQYPFNSNPGVKSQIPGPPPPPAYFPAGPPPPMMYGYNPYAPPPPPAPYGYPGGYGGFPPFQPPMFYPPPPQYAPPPIHYAYPPQPPMPMYRSYASTNAQNDFQYPPNP